MALRWIVSEDEISQGLSPSNPRFLQRYVLAVFYFSLNGDSWNTCSRYDKVCADGKTSWLMNNDECIWYTIDCNDSKMVRALEFRKCAQSFIPDFVFTQKIANFLVLQVITKASTKISSQLPYLVEFAEFHLLTSIEWLSIPEMKIDGPILDYLLDMSVLETLRIPSNQFTGTIPESFGSDHQYLSQLDLSGNNFNGPLPASLGSIIYLQMLSLSKNKFTGNVPYGLGNVMTLGTFLCL
jgi:hypothetical protein